MLKNNWFVLLCCIVFFSSCTNREKKKEEVDAVELSLAMDRVLAKVKLSDIASSVKCIPLATNDSALIGEIVRIVQSGEYVYVADRNALFKFDNKGTLVASLQQSGAGPDEYVAISDFQIAPDGTIWLLSRSNRALYQYEENHTLKEKVELDCWVSNICLVRSDKMLLYVGNETEDDQGKQVLQLDLTTKKVVDGYLPIDTKKSKYLHVRSDNYFSGGSQSSGGYFFQMFNDTVYAVSPDGALSPAFHLNIADKNIPASFFDVDYANVMDFFQNLSKHSYAYGTKLFAEYENFYLFSYYQLGECYLAALPKEKAKSGCVIWSIEADTQLQGYTFNFDELSLFVQEDNALIIPFAVSELLSYIEDNFGEEEMLKLKERFGIVSEDQNPILLCVELKKELGVH